LLSALNAYSATVAGVVADATGATVPGARVVLRGLATGQESVVETGPDGRFQFEVTESGTYLVIFSRTGFSQAARTVIVESSQDKIDLPVQMEIGGLTVEVSVTAARAERENRQIPLHVDSVSQTAIEQNNPLSTGDALSLAANVTPVGNG